MFPPKIRSFVNTLIDKTNRGEIKWVYDDDNAAVRTSQPGFSVYLRYSFNDIDEVGEFVLFYFDDAENKEYRFYTNQKWDDYETARFLFESAQSSNLKLPF